MVTHLKTCMKFQGKMKITLKNLCKNHLIRTPKNRALKINISENKVKFDINL